MGTPIVLSEAEQAMLFRLITSYQATISPAASLSEHQTAWVNIVLTVLPQVINLGSGDRMTYIQLQNRVANYYRGPV